MYIVSIVTLIAFALLQIHKYRINDERKSSNRTA